MNPHQFARILVAALFSGFLGGAISVRVAPLLAVSAQEPNVERIIEAEEFRVKDAEGRVRAILSGAELRLSGGTDSPAVRLSAGENRASLRFFDGKGGMPIFLSGSDEYGAFRVGDYLEQSIELLVEEHPRVDLVDKAGHTRAMFGVSESIEETNRAAFSFVLYGEGGEEIWSAP